MMEIAKPALASSGIVGLGAALAVGFGLVPSSTDLARVEAQSAKVAAIETVLAVHSQRLDTIEKDVASIKEAQATHFDKLMRKLERIERRGQ